ncbi:hypothetical protein SLA2020_341140 [Shorea laevis]
MNDDLCHPVSDDEVRSAVFQLGAFKAPGVDGFPGCFFQQHWDIVGLDICKAVQHFFDNGFMLREMNKTKLVLIPKIKNPEVISQFRPISLCNFSYKIIAKILANRLKGYLDNLISPLQSAFIPGWAIQDNILIAHEAFHGLKLKKSGKHGVVAFKLDIRKAYDSVDWFCLENILRAHGFCEKWIHMVMQCVTTVSYTVGINGNQTPFFVPQRGLRQGDPLSPYLYLFIADILSRLLMTATAEKKITGYKIRRRSPPISHLLFADDSLVFCQATLPEVSHLQTILQLYGDLTGQRVNFSKSAAIFSPNTPRDVRESICNRLGIRFEAAVSKYLGLPTSWGRSKRASLQYVVNKVQDKLSHWKKNLLSQAGREILIKAVAMAIPTFTMSCFLFPAGVCRDINRLIKEFWWGQQNDERKICWVSWNRLSRSKHAGGMGCKDLYCFNLAMLARQAWRLLQNPNALWVRVLKSLYFSDSSFFDARKGSHLSWAWSSILKGRDIVQLGARWNVGNGQDVLIFQDKWIPTLPGFQVISPSDHNSLFSHVCELLDEYGEWDLTKLNACFSSEECREILKIPTGACSDSLIWHHDKYGRFSVKSAYSLALNLVHEIAVDNDTMILSSSEWKQLWKLKVPPKVKNFIWRAILNSLPSMDNLVKRGIVQEALCPICHSSDETLMHLLFFCPHVEPIWFGSALGLNPRQLGANCFVEWWKYIKSYAKQMNCPSLVVNGTIICWHVWKARNEKCFEHAEISPQQVLARISCTIQECSSLNSMDLLASPSKTCTVNKKHHPSWSRPPQGTLKVNVDASFSPNLGSAALAMVGRDSNGELCFGKTWFCMALSPLMAEAAALLKAVRYVIDIGIHEVIFESDNQVLISCLQQDHKSCPWEAKSIIMSIKHSSYCHPGFSFNFIPREGNRVADWIARSSLHGQCPSYWAHRPPNILLLLLSEDVNYT